MGCHESKNCPRCAQPFECKVGNIAECQCYGITFEDTEKAFIDEQYTDCLCRDCLLAIRKEIRYKPVSENFRLLHSLINFK